MIRSEEYGGRPLKRYVHRKTQQTYVEKLLRKGEVNERNQLKIKRKFEIESQTEKTFRKTMEKRIRLNLLRKNLMELSG